MVLILVILMQLQIVSVNFSSAQPQLGMTKVGMDQGSNSSKWWEGMEMEA